MTTSVNFREYIAAAASLAEENMIVVRSSRAFKKLVLALIYLTQDTEEKRQELFISKSENRREQYTIEQFRNDRLEVYWNGAVDDKGRDFEKEIFPKLYTLAKSSSTHIPIMGKVRSFLIEKDLNYVQDLEDTVKMWETMASNPEMPKEQLIQMVQKQGIWRGWGKKDFDVRTSTERLEFLYESVQFFKKMDELPKINDEK